jgi:hypothetical protein
MNDQSAPLKESSQALQDQNIFLLLGVNDGSEEEREAFLDELQQVIWEDFLENDLNLLVTTSEHQELEPLLNQNAEAANDVSKQEELITKLEKLIPDLEEIMLEKALELKADLMRERLVGMREFYAGNEAALNTIASAEGQMQQDRWLDAAQALNQLT